MPPIQQPQTPARKRRVMAGTVVATSQKKSDAEETMTAHAVPGIAVPPAHGVVRVHLGRTINMGNFESLRIDIDVELPSDPATSAMDATKERASELAVRYYQEEEAKALGTDGVTS